MKCEWMDCVSGYADKELTPGEERAFLSHLKFCSACENELKTISETKDFISTLTDKSFKASAPDLFGMWQVKSELEKNPVQCGLFGSLLYHRRGYQFGLAGVMMLFLFGVENYGIVLTFAIFIYLWVHLFLYVRDANRGFCLCPVS